MVSERKLVTPKKGTVNINLSKKVSTSNGSLSKPDKRSENGSVLINGTFQENGQVTENGQLSEGSDDTWREVKKKNKENKVKKDLKLSSFEREELDFHFDEEFDQEVPTGRQNTFSNEW